MQNNFQKAKVLRNFHIWINSLRRAVSTMCCDTPFRFYSSGKVNLFQTRPPPKTKASPPTVHTDHPDSQIPSSDDCLYCDPGYPIETYVLA